MSNKALKTDQHNRYRLLDDGTFVIDDYNRAQPFASFFPGIAGLQGIPMWAFYVNRGQAVSAFGVKNKNYACMEFFPANNAYAFTPTLGYRTFIKVKKGHDTVVYEPFQYTDAARQCMMIKPGELALEDCNAQLGVKTTVRYCTLPQEPIAALMRTVTVENTGKHPVSLEIIDGLPKIVPYWMGEGILKSMSYTAQAWATVTNHEKHGVPFYRLKVEINDHPEVTVLKEGNFYIGLKETGKNHTVAACIIDPAVVFGPDKGFLSPHEFIAQKNFTVPKQQGDNKFPAAMSYFPAELQAGGVTVFRSLTGHIDSEENLNRLVKKAAINGFFEEKSRVNDEILDALTAPVHTVSSSRAFDLYTRQTFLDNLLRGGAPIFLPSGKEKRVFYVYSRKHGDLERDYNSFQLSATYYSQGNGNYRDTNQNRRSDIFFTPQIGDHNVLHFFNLGQLDGYNPLIVKGASFHFNVKQASNMQLLKRIAGPAALEPMKAFFGKPFEPGSLMLFLERKDIQCKVPVSVACEEILECSEMSQEADHGEGFWTDHWTYNLDLLESYLAVFPERERDLFLEKKECTFFDNAHKVLPRDEKYSIADGAVRQFGSVVLDPAKAKMLRERASSVHLVHDHKGAGQVYHTTLIVKMLCIALNKFATLDPEGIGIEMEADKPGWYDALNGLPGVFGSSIAETFELKRLLRYMAERLTALRVPHDYEVCVPEELHRFFVGLEKLLNKADTMPAYEFWDKASTLKEAYRKEILPGVSGREKALVAKQLHYFLDKAVIKINRGLDKARDAKTGLFYTYVSYEAKKFVKLNAVSHKGWPCVRITAFARRFLPFFLEGEVHYLKTETDRDAVRRLHTAVKKSPLYDRTLGMYKVNASLKDEPADIGRCTVFSPGWLENESIWLHMEYKYLLELLRAGQYKDFFEEFRKAGVCFQDPAVYGRSILENSSFIASSVFPDPAARGRGFVARLSGSTAEFISIWICMTSGQKPFGLNDQNELILELKPVIPGDFFDDRNMFSFCFLGTTLVRYHNPSRTDTFSSSVAISRMDIHWRSGEKEKVYGKIISGRDAVRIRNQEAGQIDVFF